nr:immunoglobulin heavy chain junction region [Mus musculus]
LCSLYYYGSNYDVFRCL